MAKKFVLLMLVFFGLVFQFAEVNAQVADQKEDRRPTKEQVQEMLTEGVRDSIERSLKLEDDRLLNEQKKFFDLDQKTLDELQALADRQLKREMNEFRPERLQRVLESSLPNAGLGTTYSINGKEYTVDGYESEGIYLALSVQTVNRGVSIRIKRALGTDYQHLYRIRYPHPDFHLRWAEVVEANSDKSYSDYTKMVEDRYRENVLDVMLAVVGDSLAISPEQQEPLRNWLAQHVKVDRQQKLFRNAIKGLTEIEEVPDDLLTEDQRNAWQLMISELSLH